MKRLSLVFAAAAILLFGTMCAVVGYSYADISWAIVYTATSAPAWIAFLYAIPFTVLIAVFVTLALVLYKREKTDK